MTKILILCTGNSCRSQMAEGFLQSFNDELYVRSAGTHPSGQVHPKAIRVMAELGIDISNGKPENVDQCLNEQWDYVIRVCDNAKETCPIFLDDVSQQLHIGFKDPAEAKGSKEEVLQVFRRIRDEIKNDFFQFYKNNLKQQ